LKGGLTLAGVGEALKRTIAGQGSTYDPEEDDDLFDFPPKYPPPGGMAGLPPGAPLGATISYPGQPMEHVAPHDMDWTAPGAFAKMPKWMREHVDVKQGAKATVRFMETDFIRKSRERQPKKQNIVNILQSSCPQELLDRPKKSIDTRDLR